MSVPRHHRNAVLAQLSEFLTLVVGAITLVFTETVLFWRYSGNEFGAFLLFLLFFVAGGVLIPIIVKRFRALFL